MRSAASGERKRVIGKTHCRGSIVRRPARISIGFTRTRPPAARWTTGSSPRSGSSRAKTRTLKLGMKMRIRNVVLQDFGLYRGRQILDLLPRKRHGAVRPVVLVGGHNGAGKTTILEALRLCLYGRLALG